jgi:hypothetical protein
MSDRCEPPPEGFEMAGCYVQNSAPPDLVRELVEALEWSNAALVAHIVSAGPGDRLTALTMYNERREIVDILRTARAALHRAKEAGV